MFTQKTARQCIYIYIIYGVGNVYIVTLLMEFYMYICLHFLAETLCVNIFTFYMAKKHQNSSFFYTELLYHFIVLSFSFFACTLNLASFRWSSPQRLSPPYHQPVRPMFVPLSLIHAIDDPASLHLGCHGLSPHLFIAMSSMTGVSLSLYHDECINASIIVVPLMIIPLSLHSCRVSWHVSLLTPSIAARYHRAELKNLRLSNRAMLFPSLYQAIKYHCHIGIVFYYRLVDNSGI